MIDRILPAEFSSWGRVSARETGVFSHDIPGQISLWEPARNRYLRLGKATDSQMRRLLANALNI